MENYFLLTFLFILSALADYAELTYYWQLKEYRLDRFNDFLSSRLGQNFIFSYKTLARPVIFTLLILNPTADFKLLSALSTIFVLDLISSFVKYVRGKYVRPKITFKAVSVILTAIIFEASILGLALAYASLYLPILASSRFVLAALAVILINLPFGLIKKIYLKRAAKKLASYKNLLVIGVTGSYGKTTVKNFLSQMLSLKYKVVAPPKNVNTELGIAKFILATDFSGADIFVVEMAAYKIGEIKLICEMVKPTIGVLTAINEQHLPLFGSLTNTQTAKYELLRALPSSGLAVVNADNKYAREFIGELKSQVKTFGRLKEFDPDCLISDLSDETEELKFKASPDYEIKTKIIGPHNAMNIAPVILIAAYLGFDKTEIQSQALKLKLPEATLELKNYGKNLIIDDSYNANPASFASALNYLKKLKTSGEKIVITRGMIELGEASRAAHEKIGRLTAEIADELVIISPDSAEDLKRGTTGTNLKIKNIYEPAELLNYLKSLKNVSNSILLEGRLPEIIKKEIK